MKNKLNLLLLTLTLLIVIMPFSLAQDYLPQKQATQFNLIISSNNASACNFTYIQYPDGSITSSQKAMTKSGTDFNYIISAGNFTQLGSTCMGVTCYDGLTYETGSVCREVTPSGFTSTTTFFFIFIVIIGLVFLMGVVLKNTWIMMLGSILVILFGFFIILNGVDIIKDMRTTWGIGLIVWALGIYFMYLSVEEQLKEWN